MPERYSSDPGLRGSSDSEADHRFQDDPLAELARIVSSPSPLSEGGASFYSLPGTPAAANSAPNNPSSGNSALDEKLESELTGAASAQEGIDPFADLSWLDAEAAKPSAVEPQPASSEPNFDELVNMHMRRAGRPGMRRTPARSQPAVGAGWDGVDLDQPPSADANGPLGADASRPAPSDAFSPARAASAAQSAAPFSDAPPLQQGAMAAGAEPGEAKSAAFGEDRFSRNSALFDEFSDDDEAGGRRGPSRMILLAAAAAVLVVLGGYGVLTYFSRDAAKPGTPGVIAADKSPVKAAPAASAASAVAARDAAANNKLVYDRVDEPAADKLKATAAPNTAAPRPETQTTDAGRELARLAAEGAANDGSDQAANVKRVRTVVVRPDGTVVPNPPANPPAAAPAVRPTTPNTAAPAATPAAAPAAANAARPAIANPAPAAAPAASAAANTAANTAAKTNTAPAPTAPAASATAAAAKPTPGATAPAPTAAAAAPTTVVAANSAAKPATQPAPAAAAPKPAAAAPVPLVPESADAKPAAARTASVAANSTAIVPGAEGWVVQITSQKSESAALTAFKDMQKRFPALLGNRQPDMQRVDLGSRGVFYRVRVGPVGPQDAASGLCDTLKGGGADCIVVRN